MRTAIGGLSVILIILAISSVVFGSNSMAKSVLIQFTSEPTFTPLPTATPTATTFVTFTPLPTSTATPTNTATPFPTPIPTLPPSSLFEYCGQIQLSAGVTHNDKTAIDCGVPANAVNIRFFAKVVNQVGTAQVVASTSTETFICVLNGVGTFCTYNIADTSTLVNFDLDCFGSCVLEVIEYDLIIYYNTPTATPTTSVTFTSVPVDTNTPTATATPGGPTATITPTGSDFTATPIPILPTVTPPNFDSPDLYPPPTTIPNIVPPPVNVPNPPTLSTDVLPTISLPSTPQPTIRPINTGIGIAPYTPAPISSTLSQTTTNAYNGLTGLLTNTNIVISNVASLTTVISNEITYLNGGDSMITVTVPSTWAIGLPDEMREISWRFETMRQDTTKRYTFSDWITLAINTLTVPIHLIKGLMEFAELLGPIALFLGWVLIMIPIALFFKYSNVLKAWVIALVRLLWEIYKHIISWIPGVG